MPLTTRNVSPRLHYPDHGLNRLVEPDQCSVDGLVKCDKWIRDNENGAEKSKAAWWLNRLMERTKKVDIDWPFPFAENKLFVLALETKREDTNKKVTLPRELRSIRELELVPVVTSNFTLLTKLVSILKGFPPTSEG